MARPTKNGGEKLSVSVRVRGSVAEKKRIDAEAAECGLSLSDWVRTKTINAKPLYRKPTPDRAVLLKLLASHGKVGSLVNQIARQCNRKQDSEEFQIPIAAIMHTMELIRTVTNEIRDALEHVGTQRKNSRARAGPG